jgi:co-chaperonin GroES (HSP10)
MRPLIDASWIVPLGERLVVKPYVMPDETPGGIIIPEPYRDNRMWDHFEYVSGSTKALRRLGLTKLHVGAIIRTRLKMPADSGYDDEADGQPLMFLNAEDVAQIIIWKDEAEGQDDSSKEQ